MPFFYNALYVWVWIKPWFELYLGIINKEVENRRVFDTKQSQLFLCWYKRLGITDWGLRTGTRHWHRIATTKKDLTKSPFCHEQLTWLWDIQYDHNSNTVLWVKAASAFFCGCRCMSGKLHLILLSLSLPPCPLPGLPLDPITSQPVTFHLRQCR